MLKLIDLGSAALCLGDAPLLNYYPGVGPADPRYCKPGELYLLPEGSPRPTEANAEKLWRAHAPDRFDSFSAGCTMMQLAVVGLREEAQLATFLEELESAGFELARWRSGAGASRGLDFAALDANGDAGWDLAAGLLAKERAERTSCEAALQHPSSGDWRSGTRVRIVVGDARAETRVSRSSSLVHDITSSRNERVVARIRWFYSSIFLSLVRRDGVAVYSAGRWYTSGSSLASTGARGVCPASECDPPPKQAKKSPRPYGRPGTSSRTRSPWVTTTREARPRGSRSDSRRRRGASRWSRSCAEFARSSARGARTSRSCAGWARERRGRRRWLRTGEGGASVRPCEKTSSVFAPVQRCPSREARGKDPSRGRGRRTSARGTGLRDGRAHRARREDGVERVDVALAGLASMDAARSGPLPGCVAKRGGSSFPATGSADSSSGVASAREIRDEQDAWYTDAGRRSVTGRFREIPLESIFPDFSPHGTLTDEDSNC